MTIVGPAILAPAMDDAVTDAEHTRAAVTRAQPCGERIECPRGRHARRRPACRRRADAGLASFAEKRGERADAFDLAPRVQSPAIGRPAADTRRTSGSTSPR